MWRMSSAATKWSCGLRACSRRATTCSPSTLQASASIWERISRAFSASIFCTSWSSASTTATDSSTSSIRGTAAISTSADADSLALRQEKRPAFAGLSVEIRVRSATPLRAFEARLRFTDGLVGFLVFFRVFAVFVPLLVALVELLLSRSRVDILGLLSALGEDGHPLGKHLDEASRHVETLIAALAAMQAHLAGAQFGQQRRVPI